MANRRKIDRAVQARAALSRTKVLALQAARLTAIAIGIFGAGAGGFAGYHWLTTSPRFALAQIELAGLVEATGPDARRLVGISEGDNLFLADTAAAERQLATHPWIRSARVERRFPQGLVVVVLERKAVALVDLGGLYLLDEQGEVFKRVLPGDPVDLPVITGLTREDWIGRRRESRERISEAVAVLDAYTARLFALRMPPAELHLDATDGVTLYAGDGGEASLALRLGRDAVEAKLDRLEQVLAELARRGQTAEVVHLDNRARPGWIAARIAAPQAPAAGAPQQKKTGRKAQGPLATP